MRLIIKYVTKYKKLLLIDFLCVFGFALVELGIPTFIAEMIDVGIRNNDNEYIIKMGLFIFLISVIGSASMILLGYCSSRISIRITRDIRNDVFAKIQSFSHSEYNKFGVSSMITRTMNDAFQLQLFTNILLRTAFMTPVVFLLSIILIVKTSIPLSLVMATAIPFIILTVVVIAKMSKPISKKQQRLLDTINRMSRENITGTRVIRSFRNREYESNRFDENNVEYAKISKKLFYLMNATQPIFYFLLNIAILAIYWISALMINDGALQVGELTAFLEYAFHTMFSAMLFCTVFIMYPKAQVSASRIQEIFDEQPDISNPTQVERDIPELGTLEFKHVTFSYPNGEESILKDISFSAQKGETIAFIGSTGSGKSTLVNLIPRFYDVSKGEILVDGVNVKNFDLHDLRSRIGFIPQKALLFTGTIEENIRFGKKEADEEELLHSTQISQAYEFILNKPDKFNEILAEGGSNLSGGQKQRLSIARAVVRKPEFYVFDDIFSALDFKTDATIRALLKEETQESIVLIVAQRVSSITNADQIIVLNEGMIVGKGSHKELLQDCKIYQEIAASQLSEEELAK